MTEDDGIESGGTIQCMALHARFKMMQRGFVEDEDLAVDGVLGGVCGAHFETGDTPGN